MFVHVLNKIQQSALLALAERLVESDQQHLEEKQKRLLAIRRQMPGIEPTNPKLEMLGSVFTTRQTRMVLLLELIWVSMTAGTIADGKNTMLRDIAKAVGMYLEEVDKIISWSAEALYLFRGGYSLMEA